MRALQFALSSQVLSCKQGIFSALGRFERTQVYWPAAVDVLQLLAHLQLPTTTSTWGALRAHGSVALQLEPLAWGLIFLDPGLVGSSKRCTSGTAPECKAEAEGEKLQQSSKKSEIRF